MNESEANLSLPDQLPDDPMLMPPPYWRSSGAIFHINDALESLTILLPELMEIHEQTEIRLEEYHAKHPDESSDPEGEEFGEICDGLWMLEHKIKLKTEIAIFMSAIQAEDDLNRFCVYNLHKDIAESIEKLSPPEKLLVASAVVGQSDTKGQAAYEAIKKLSSWRNAFAHGHCVDRPTKSLRHNHLISPPYYPSVPNSLASMKQLLESYVRFTNHLISVSVNPYTASNCSDTKQAEEYLKELASFKFHTTDESGSIYDIEYDG